MSPVLFARCGVPLAAALLVPLAAPAATLIRGPYLQQPKPAGVTVVWQTDEPARCGLALRPDDGPERTLHGTTGRECAVAVDDLVPGGRYGYVPLAGDQRLLDESVFRTGEAGKPFAFAVLGDSGCPGCPEQRAVAARIGAGPADFILHTGDMNYPNGRAEDFDPTVFTPYRDLMRRLVLWPCRGNHDVRTDGGAPWRSAFRTPANNPAGSDDYYSFDYGDAHVVVLDSNAPTAPDSAQYAFLQHDLAHSRAPWKFVVLHHPLYSSGLRHGSNFKIRANLVPLFDRWRVDVVFMGHDHDYERTHPLRADQKTEPGQGTVYVTTGGGGYSIRKVGSSDFTAHAESAFHFVRIRIAGDRLQGEMVRADGAIGDRFEVKKAAAASAPK
jgi:acid phosphatase type 7